MTALKSPTTTAASKGAGLSWARLLQWSATAMGVGLLALRGSDPDRDRGGGFRNRRHSAPGRGDRRGGADGRAGRGDAAGGGDRSNRNRQDRLSERHRSLR